MNTKPFLLMLGAAAFLQTTSCLVAQEWETVDQPTGSNVRALASTADGSLYSLVWLPQADGTVLKYVRRSSDSGTSWTTVSEVLAVPATKLVSDAGNNLYIAGVNSTGDHWNVLKSEDGGQTWAALYAGNSLAFWELYDVAVDSSGAIYVAGSSYVSGPGSQQIWTVRRGASGNGVWNWSTVDSFALTSRNNSRAQTIAIKPANVAGQPEQVYVGGLAYPKSGDSQWIVRRSNGGTTWTTVDATSTGNQCMALSISPVDGSVFTVGSATQPATRKTPAITYTVVRKGTFDATASNAIRWTEQARFVNPYAIQSLTADAFGRVFLSGSGEAPFGWRVWASPDGNAPYYVTDAFSGGTAFSVTVDMVGNVLAGGRFPDPVTGSSTALVRRLSVP